MPFLGAAAVPPPRPRPRRPGDGWLWAAALAVCVVLGSDATGLRPESPEVRRLIEDGLDTLESLPADDRLGGECVAALALHKGGRPSSRRIRDAIDFCNREAARLGDLQRYDQVYSLGLAAILLAEVDPVANRGTLKSYINALAERQMDHGGWGYATDRQGDTSQTQYVALGLWSAHRAGLAIDPKMVKGLIAWLSHTQAPDGAWPYKGTVAEGSVRIDQYATGPTMTAAASASLMIGADLHGLLAPGALAVAGDMSAQGGDLPPAVRRVRDEVAQAKALPPAGADWARVADCLRLGEEWMAKPYRMPGNYPNYYLYALERYHSFREVRVGKFEDDPAWYEEGFQYLVQKQAGEGQWNAGCGPVPDTAFAVLFLIRATQKSLSRDIGEGALISGRGLPKNVAGARLRRGQVVVDVDAVGVGDFLAMMSRGESDRLDALAENPAALQVDEVSQSEAAELERVLRSGPPDTRRLAARALGRLGGLDRVPALIFGLTDPDRRVAIESRDALRRIARRPQGFGMPDDFSEDERYSAAVAWRDWLLALRPEAIVDLGR